MSVPRRKVAQGFSPASAGLPPSRLLRFGVPRRSSLTKLASVGRKACATLMLLVFPLSQSAFAYLKFGVRVGGRQVTLHWTQTPVRYFVSDRSSVPGVAVGDFQAAVGRAFETWQAVPSATITYQFGGLTGAQPGDEDGLSTLGFRDRPDLDRVLASTSFVIDMGSGALIESDIFFNSSFQWSVQSSGEANRFDLQSIALHEVGHLSGLGHSALGETELREGGGRRVIASEAVMFPIAFSPGSTAGRVLKADDIAGISDLYPENGAAESQGAITGRVTKNGQPVFGAHVVAFDPQTSTMVGSFTLNAQGEFSIGALSPGPRLMRIEPLDDADLDSFFGSSQVVDLDFRVTFVDRLIVVPRGGGTGTIELKVVPK
jgi:matrixin